MTEGELAQTLSQISLHRSRRARRAARRRARATGRVGATVGDTIADGAHDPVEAYEVDEMKHLLADAINRMPDRERLVLTLYYYEGLTLAEIGDILGVTESRVCQIHTKAILQLRGRLSRTRTRDRARPLLIADPPRDRLVARARRSAGSGRTIDFLPALPRRRVVHRPRGWPCGLRIRAPRVARSSLVLVIVARRLVVVLGRRRRPRRRRRARPAAWLRPVDGRGRRDPSSSPRRCTGPGTGASTSPPRPARRCAPPTTASSRFAGSVAGTLHVTVAHAGGLRTSYSFLAVGRGPRPGRTVARGDVVGTTGGAGDDHDGARAPPRPARRRPLRRPDAAVPARPTSPSSCGSCPPTSPTRRRGRRPASAASCRRRCTSRRPAPGVGGAVDRDDGGVRHGIPLVGGVVDAGLRRRRRGSATASDEARRRRASASSTPSTDLADDVLDGLRVPLARRRSTRCARSPARSRPQLARTPAGMLALDVVEIGRRFVDTVTAECSDDAPDADGTGGSAHRVMVVAGINSAGAAWDRGPTVELDVEALGYQRDEGEVRYYSYAADGGPYDRRRHPRPDRRVAAHRLASNSAAMQRGAARARGRPDRALAGRRRRRRVPRHALRRRRPDVPAARATWSRCRRRTRARRSPPRGADPFAARSAARRCSTPARGRVVAPAARAAPRCSDLAERSELIARRAARTACPSTSTSPRSAPPRTSSSRPHKISLRGATRDGRGGERAAAQHSAIVRDPDALRAVRAALEGRAPPCVGLDTALRGAVAPVVISRLEHGPVG